MICIIYVTKNASSFKRFSSFIVPCQRLWINRKRLVSGSRGKVHNVCNSFQAVLLHTIGQSQADIFKLSCWCCGIKGEFSDKIGIVLPGTWWRAGAGWAWWINDLSFTFLGKKSQFINTSSWYTAAAGAAGEVVYCQQYNRVISSFIFGFCNKLRSGIYLKHIW